MTRELEAKVEVEKALAEAVTDEEAKEAMTTLLDKAVEALTTCS